MIKKSLPKILVLLTVLLIAFSGCNLKGKGPDQNTPVTVVPAAPEGGTVSPPENNNGGAPETTAPLGPASPISCNDDLIVKTISKYLGESYIVNKLPPQLGGTVQNAPCIIKKDNVAQVTYSISEQPDNNTAVAVLEDEKNQLMQQLFRNSIEQAAIGSKNYLFKLPVREGSNYRLIFVDDTNTKVVVYIKSSMPVDKELILKVGRALDEVI